MRINHAKGNTRLDNLEGGRSTATERQKAKWEQLNFTQESKNQYNDDVATIKNGDKTQTKELLRKYAQFLPGDFKGGVKDIQTTKDGKIQLVLKNGTATIDNQGNWEIARNKEKTDSETNELISTTTETIKYDAQGKKTGKEIKVTLPNGDYTAKEVNPEDDNDVKSTSTFVKNSNTLTIKSGENTIEIKGDKKTEKYSEDGTNVEIVTDYEDSILTEDGKLKDNINKKQEVQTSTNETSKEVVTTKYKDGSTSTQKTDTYNNAVNRNIPQTEEIIEGNPLPDNKTKTTTIEHHFGIYDNKTHLTTSVKDEVTGDLTITSTADNDIERQEKWTDNNRKCEITENNKPSFGQKTITVRQNVGGRVEETVTVYDASGNVTSSQQSHDATLQDGTETLQLDGRDVSVTSEGGREIKQSCKDDSGKTHELSYSYDKNGKCTTSGIVVRFGDTIQKLAQRYGVTVSELTQANSGKIHSQGGKQYFYAGDLINVPKKINASNPEVLKDDRQAEIKKYKDSLTPNLSD